MFLDIKNLVKQIVQDYLKSLRRNMFSFRLKDCLILYNLIVLK
jgi:hypothetical protein